MEKVLISGITGQDGSLLADLLLEKNYEVHGIVRRSSSFNTKRIDHLYESPLMGTHFFTHYGDMTDSNCISALVEKIKPDLFFNMAAQSHVKTSFDCPSYTAQVDAIGTLNVLEAIKNHAPECRVLQASTSEMFGGVYSEMPRGGYNENSYFHPMSPYGCSKVFAYWITRNYRDSYNLFASNSICFNHESHRRGSTFVTKKITEWFAKYCYYKHPFFKNKHTPLKQLKLGNLDAYRDWSDARDVVEAMYLIINHDKPDDFVVSSGETYRVRDFIELCFQFKGLFIEWEGDGDNEIGRCNGEIVVAVDPKYYRPSEVEYLLGDNTKLRKTFGWRPKYNFESMVQNMILHDFAEQGIDFKTGEIL